MAPASATVDVLSYQDLYERWEQSNWSAMALDFSQDVEGWRSLSDIQRRSAMWTYSMFFYGEDSVTDNLSPYIDAAPKEEQKYFLATQQVDEARHSVFFHRFFNEVIGAGGDSVAAGLAATEPELNWSYRKTFELLDRTAMELRRDRSLPMFAKAITMYHIVVESILAQPGQHYIEDFFTKSGQLPGFQEGMSNVSRDEQRHIGFGVKVLADLYRESEECKAATVELLREALRVTVGVFNPPNWDREYTRCYGFEVEEIFAFGFSSLQTKMQAAGFPLEEMPPDLFPFPLELSAEERAEIAVSLAEAGVIGNPVDRPDSSPETQRRYFDLLARSVNTEAVNGQPVTLQWRFPDAGSWHIQIANGQTRAEPGEAADPDLTLESGWADFVHIGQRVLDPRKALVTRRLRPHGSLRLLARMPKILNR